eukprot:gene10008-2327_t
MKNQYPIVKNFIQQNYPKFKLIVQNYYFQIRNILFPMIIQNIYDFFDSLIEYLKIIIKDMLKSIYLLLPSIVKEFKKLIALVLDTIFYDVPKFTFELVKKNIEYIKSIPSYLYDHLILLKNYTTQSFIELFKSLKETPKLINYLFFSLLNSIKYLSGITPKLINYLKEMISKLIENLTVLSKMMLQSLIANIKQIPSTVNEIFISIKKTVW